MLFKNHSKCSHRPALQLFDAENMGSDHRLEEMHFGRPSMWSGGRAGGGDTFGDRGRKRSTASLVRRHSRRQKSVQRQAKTEPEEKDEVLPLTDCALKGCPNNLLQVRIQALQFMALSSWNWEV